MKEGEDAYFDFSKEEKDFAIRFLLESVIRSRGNCGLASNRVVYDEDVNIYLAHLLFAISTSSYQKLAHKYVVMYPSDLLNFVDSADDNYIKYFIYKINADQLLIQLSVFDESVMKLNGGKPEEKKREAVSETAQGYYEQAQFYNQRIYRRKTAIGDVLGKLARHFDQYRLVLQVTRKDFFSFVNHYKDQNFSEFVSNVKDYEKEAWLREKQDTFLDLYSEWMKAPESGGLKDRINELCAEIRQLDPSFRFSLP